MGNPTVGNPACDAEIAAQNKAYRPWQIKIFTATWLAYAGYYFCRKAFYVAKADQATALGFTTMDLAHLGTAYLAAYMIGQYSSAFFGKKLGPKVLLLMGMGISLACNFFFGINNGFWTMFTFLAINGLAQGTGWPGCIGSLAFWFRRKERGSILGVWSTCYQLGPVLATAFAAYLLGHIGWRWSYFGASTVLLVVWVAVLILHPNKPEDVGLTPISEDEDECPAPVFDKNGKQKDSLGWTPQVVFTIILMGVIYFAIKFLRYALWSWAPFFLNKNFGLAGDNAGYLSTVFELFGFLGVLFAGFASDKLFKGKRAFLTFAMLAIMTLSFVLMATLGATSVFFFAASMGLAGFMLFGPDSLLSGVGAIDVGSKRGAIVAAGIINGTGSIGPIFQEEIIGWLYKTHGGNLSPILYMLMGMSIVGTFFTMILWLRSRSGKANL